MERSRLRGMFLLSCKRKQVLQGISQRGKISGQKASPIWRAGLLRCKHHLTVIPALSRQKKIFGITLNGILGNQAYVAVICQHVLTVIYRLMIA